jgi:hypothetical protein
MDTTREIREMPTILVREAGLEEFNEKTRKSLREFSEELPKESDLSEENFQQLDPRLRSIPWDADPQNTGRTPSEPLTGQPPDEQTGSSTEKQG